MWKFQDKETILAERQKKEFEKMEKERKKEEDKLRLKLEEEEKMKLNPKEMFLGKKEYSEWDEQGIPTKNAAGKEVSGKARDKLLKVWEKQNI